ncbi:type IX secretion system outer membrane channel protein PorV [Bernardetia sp.]|uniref:type IX secretion system outer membrane channel protein PorV n=1 Tax=Bernardetia sp. TaxID=1937974 RepID=UPI0025B9D8F2|nr:type IX secretion system outer membrane channel protein PorV [Bernardetia sp.]
MQAIKIWCILSIVFFLSIFLEVKAQVVTNPTNQQIITAVPSLCFSPDARASGMGNTGIATSADINATFWNPSKLTSLEKEWNFGASYSPMLRRIVDDIWLGYFSAAKKLNEKQTIAISSRYFGKGDIIYNNSLGQTQELSLGRDLAIDATFAQKVSKKLSLAGTFRYINSEQAIFDTQGNPSVESHHTGAVDISALYESGFTIKEKQVDWNFGVNISNIGAPIVVQSVVKEYLPANLGIGTAFTNHLNQDNLLTFTFDVNKLLVPTPNPSNPTPTQSVFSSIFSSFSDAPNGFREEMQELILSLGTEYSYKDKLKLRGGYYQESRNKGNNRFVSLGTGYEHKFIELNVSFIKATTDNSIYDETFQVSMICSFDSKKKTL